MKMFDGSLLFEKHSIKRTKNTQIRSQHIFYFSDHQCTMKTFSQNTKRTFQFFKDIEEYSQNRSKNTS